ncbi:MAG: hypothetical protein HYT62_00450 [Candidatus Yanofskybacteria bacterium]|nr:hypothetical protein [Candidatus Yanofskybacteria bacterium]
MSFGRFVYYDENVGDGFDELLLNATMLSTNKKLAGTAQKTIDRANEISQKLISKLDEIRVVIRNPVGEVQSASSVVEACLEFCKDPSAMSSYVGMFRAMKEAEES